MSALSPKIFAITTVTSNNPGGASVQAPPGFPYCPSWARTRTLLIQNVADWKRCTIAPPVTGHGDSGLRPEYHARQHGTGIGDGELTDCNESHCHDSVACRKAAVSGATQC